MVRKLLMLQLVFVVPLFSLANNLQFSAAQLQGDRISITVSWSNAWNIANGSHDAVWVFVKAKRSNGIWEHVQLSATSNDHICTNPLTVVAAADGKGVFIRTIDEGQFSIPATLLLLKINQNIANYSQIRVYGIEMVYIPKGPYYLGDGASISSIGGVNGLPYQIDSEQVIPNGTLSLVNPNSYFVPPLLVGDIPLPFPKGFNPFYIMKYEVSQQQYVDFLNTLTYTQQKNRTWRSPNMPVGSFIMVNPNVPDSLHRNAIVIAKPGIENTMPAIYAVNGNGNSILNEINDAQHRAANFLSWADLAAYLDWAALRPITEMEFEKACRGFQSPVAGEFSWGTRYVVNANSVINDGTEFESVVEVSAGQYGLANHGNIVASEGWGLRGPLRTGFAASEGTTRIGAGASYFGVMELSGNLWEITIAANADGLSFSGATGDGLLDANGNANVPYWCSSQTASGVIVRGGGWSSIVAEAGAWRDLAVSDRYYSHLKPSMRRNTFGGRGGR